MPVSVPFTGGCACGAIRSDCSAAPLLVWKCHCRDCQRATGSAFKRGAHGIGETVSITPVDYGRDNPSIGTLVSIDARRMALQHHHERTGLVTVHFPRFGYTVRPVSP